MMNPTHPKKNLNAARLTPPLALLSLSLLLVTPFGCGKTEVTVTATVEAEEEPTTTTRSFLFVNFYDSTAPVTQKLMTFSVDRTTGALTYVSAISDLSNPQNIIAMNNHLYVPSRGEGKLRVFSVNTTTGVLTDATSSSGSAVTDLNMIGEIAADATTKRLFVPYQTAGGLKRVRILQSDTTTGVLTNLASGTDSTSGLSTSNVSSIAYSEAAAQLFMATDSPELVTSNVTSATGVSTSIGSSTSYSIGTLFAYPGTSWLLLARSVTDRIYTFQAPFGSMAALVSPTQTYNNSTDTAYTMVKHPTLDVLYATNSIFGVDAYSFGTTTGTLTKLNSAGVTTALTDPDAAEGLDVLSTGRFLYATHGVTPSPYRIEYYPLNGGTGAFSEGVNTVDLSGYNAGYPRFLKIVDYTTTE